MFWVFLTWSFQPRTSFARFRQRFWNIFWSALSRPKQQRFHTSHTRELTPKTATIELGGVWNEERLADTGRCLTASLNSVKMVWTWLETLADVFRGNSVVGNLEIVGTKGCKWGENLVSADSVYRVFGVAKELTKTRVLPINPPPSTASTVI